MGVGDVNGIQYQAPTNLGQVLRASGLKTEPRADAGLDPAAESVRSSSAYGLWTPILSTAPDSPIIPIEPNYASSRIGYRTQNAQMQDTQSKV